MARSTLTVFFENPFWVGVYERIDGDRYEVCKITFGAEPKDYEVWDFLLKNWSKLKFSPPIKAEREVAEAEGVTLDAISDSVLRGLANMRNYLKENW